MEARIGAFFQKASETFGLTHIVNKTNGLPSVASEQTPVLPDTPPTPNFDQLRVFPLENAIPENNVYPNKRKRPSLKSTDSGCQGSEYDPLTPENEGSQMSDVLVGTDEIPPELLGSEDSDHPSPFINGPSRVVSVNEGGKQCLAVLISEDFIVIYNEMKIANAEVTKKTGPLRQLEREVRELRMELDEVQDALNGTENQEDLDRMQHEAEDLQSNLRKVETETVSLKWQIMPFENNLRRSVNELQDVLGEAFEKEAQLEAFLPCVESDEDEEDESEEKQSEQHSVYSSTVASDHEDTPADPEEERRRAAIEDLHIKEWAMNEAQDKFDARREDYEQELANYHQLTAMGSISYTKTDFDLYDFKHVQGLTQQLRDAEEQYEIAKKEAEALNVPIESEYDEVPDDGYRDSQEVALMATCDRSVIEKWWTTFSHTDDPAEPRIINPADADPWAAKPIDVSESLSVVDLQGFGDQIESWKNHCSTLREEQTEKGGAYDAWESDMPSLRRRCSI